MTVPNTPAGPDARADSFEGASYLPEAPRPRRPLLPELLIGLLITAVGALLGLLVGVLWFHLAPRVMLVAGTDAIRYVDPEGEQRAGADSVFVLLGLGAGLLTALVAFLLTRRRGGGISVAAGLAAGGLAGSVIAWKLGMWLGPSTNVLANAKHAGLGVDFSAAIQLGSHGALLVWPITAMVVLLALSAAFGKREEDPPPYWAGPQDSPVRQDSLPENRPEDRPENLPEDRPADRPEPTA